MAQPGAVRQWPAVLGTAATVVALAVWEVASRVGSGLPGRVLIVPVLLAVVYTSFVGGVRWAIASAGLASLGAFIHELAAVGGMLEREAVVSAATMAFAFLGTGLVIGTLRTRSDRATSEALQAREEQAHAVEDRNRSLKTANANLEAFTYVVSHDLKEPIRGMDILLDALEEDHGAKLDADGRDLITRCREANERLARLVEGLLELSRASAGVFDRRPVDLSRFFATGDCTAPFAPLIEERGATVEYVTGRDPPLVHANESALCQILRNLILNAIRHNPRDRPHVRVRVLPRGQKVAIVVEDDGPGFGLGQLRKLNLESPHASRVTKEGGFGLVIVRRVADLIGGEVVFGERPGGGGSVTVVLDRAEGPRP